MKTSFISSLFLIIYLACETLSAQSLALNEVDNSYIIGSKQRGRSRGGIIKVGVGINYLNVAEPSPKLRFHVGLSPTIPLNKEYYIKPEIALTWKGGNATYNSSYFDGHITYRLSYFEFPLMLGFKLMDKIALEFGGYGALLLSGNFDFNGTFFSGYGDFNQDELNNFDYGLIGGIVFSGRRIKLGIRYYHGLQEVASMSTASTFLGNATTHTIQLYFQRNSLRERLGN